MRADGDYVVDQFELPSSLPQALAIPTAHGEYWVDYRRPLGNDAALPAAAFAGFEVRLRLPALLSSSLSLHPTLLLSRPATSFRAPDVFSLALVRTEETRAVVRFRWLDRTRPAAAALRRPFVARDGLRLEWEPARDAGSGVDHYDVFLDGRRVGTTTATRETVALPRRGPHTLRVVAVDRAGIRGRAATRRFVL